MKQLIKSYGKAIWVLGILVAFQACYPGGSIPITDLDTVSTYYNTEDFAEGPPASAAIVWEVVEIIDEDDPDNNIPYNGEVDDEILNTTLLELVKLYGEANVVIIAETSDNLVPAPANSNIQVIVPSETTDPPAIQSIVSPSILLRKEYVGVVYPGYPWWGGGWWGGWWGGCWYCGYPPQVSYQRFDVGSVRLDMFDARQIPTDGTIPSDFDASWVALFRGLISSNNTTNSERVTTSITQAYVQSPYLKP